MRTESLVLTEDILHEAYERPAVQTPPEMPPYLMPATLRPGPRSIRRSFAICCRRWPATSFSPAAPIRPYARATSSTTERRRYDFQDDQAAQDGAAQATRDPLGHETTIALRCLSTCFPIEVTDPPG